MSTVCHVLGSAACSRAVLHGAMLQGNVRGLLGSLQTVLWKDSGWQPINMGDLLEPTQVG